MPTDIAGLVTGQTYPPVVLITTDGEDLTESADTVTAVAILDRIEFVKQAVNFVATKIPPFVSLVEEFMSFAYLSNILLCDHSWRWSDSGSTIIQFAPVNDKNPGGVQMTANNSADWVALHLGEVPTSPVYKPNTIDRFDAIIETVSGGGILNSSRFFVGLAEDMSSDTPTNVHGLGFLFDPGASPNWQVWVKSLGGEVLTDTGVELLAGVTYQLEAKQDSLMNWAFEINEVVVANAIFGVDPVVSTENVNFGCRLENVSTFANKIIRRLAITTKNLSPRYT